MQISKCCYGHYHRMMELSHVLEKCSESWSFVTQGAGGISPVYSNFYEHTNRLKKSIRERQVKRDEYDSVIPAANFC